MTSDEHFSAHAARLREFIRRHSPGAPDADRLPREESERQFNALALDLFGLHYAQNPAYRRLGQARKKFPMDVTHWTEIPAAPAVAFKEMEMTTLCDDERTTVFHSSGTTEQKPSRHFHNSESLALYEASLLPWFAEHLLPEQTLPSDPGFGTPTSVGRNAASPGPLPTEVGVPIRFSGSMRETFVREIPTPAPATFLILTPPPELAPHSSLVHMFAAVRRVFGTDDLIFAGTSNDDGWSLDLEKILFRIRQSMESKRPLMLLGTAFNFVHLLDHLAANNLSLPLPEGSRVLETGGYKGRSRTLLKAELHALINKHLGIPAGRIVCEYGMSELSSQAYDWVAGSQNEQRLFHFPPWARVQIISPETGREVGEGETGLIRILDLANLRSVLAVQTEDLGVRRGVGFALLGRAPQAEARGCSLMDSDFS